MKIIISIITLTFLISSKILAQSPHPPGTHLINNEIDKFVGTWLWYSGSDTFKIFLKKQTIHYPSPLNYDEDLLIGWHLYITNGTVNQSSMSNINLQFEWSHPENISILGSTTSSNRVFFTKFRDYVKNKNCEMILTMLPNSTTQANFQLRNSRGLKIGNFDYAISMPTHLTLYKQ